MKINGLGIGLALLYCLAGTSVMAADRYVLPQGAGTRDGSSWENALAASAGGLQKGWDALTPGDTCFVGGGQYADVTLSLSSGGAKGKYKKLTGVNRAGQRPVFTGSWTREQPAKGRDFVTAKEGASYWSLENLEIRNYRIGIVSTGGRHTGVRIVNVDVTGARSGIELTGGAPAAQPDLGTHDVLIQDCAFTGYTKRGIRFQGGNYNVRVVNCIADAGGAPWAVEPFQMGFAIQGAQTSVKQPTGAAPDHDITFEGCVAKNNYNDAGDKYWNADGFCAEGTPYNLRYVNCRAFDNTDGGWDDKSRNPVLINCVALRNKRNFRFWTTKGVAVLTNCIGAFSVKPGGSGTETGLWTQGSVRAENCTFHNNGIAVDLDGAKDGAKASVELRRCILSSDASKGGVLSTVEPGGKLMLIETVTWQEGKSGEDPRFRSARATWDGTGTGMDSQRYGKAKGYHSGFMVSAANGSRLKPSLARSSGAKRAQALTLAASAVIRERSR
jgi:hypothetical protein